MFVMLISEGLNIIIIVDNIINDKPMVIVN